MVPNAIRPFHSANELACFVTAFETCSLPRRSWNHRTLLALAMWYLSHHPEADATEKVIGGIRRYAFAKKLAATSPGAYHETHTLFWLAVARRYLATAANGAVVDRVNGFVGAYAEREDLVLDYYSPEVIASWQARQGWVEPDRKTLDL